MEPDNDFDLLHNWATELGCTADELRSAMGESGRSLFDYSPSEQFELDLGAPA
ncbi:MAG TPA: hypothetical protein VM183_06725 [Burkholderiales bacterium]|nr:hypothetical protein [Burkholderiales bacterium]